MDTLNEEGARQPLLLFSQFSTEYTSELILILLMCIRRAPLPCDANVTRINKAAFENI